MDRVEVEIRSILRTTTIKKHKNIERWIITSEMWFGNLKTKKDLNRPLMVKEMLLAV